MSSHSESRRPRLPTGYYCYLVPPPYRRQASTLLPLPHAAQPIASLPQASRQPPPRTVPIPLPPPRPYRLLVPVSVGSMTPDRMVEKSMSCSSRQWLQLKSS